MTEEVKVKLCALCNENEGIKSILYGNSYYKVCPNCFNELFKGIVEKGIEKFVDWSVKMYEYQDAYTLCIRHFGYENTREAFKALDKPIAMFTYGILKYPYNIESEGGLNIVEDSIVKGHNMYATSGKSFPVTKVTGNNADIVYGTYFEVPLWVVLSSYDVTEGYSPSNDPSNNMYNRTLVDVTLPNGEVKQANMYIANESWFTESMIPEFQIMTGNYDDKATHMRQILDAKKEGETV